MHRDLDRLTGRTFDVLVVGGGIYGLITAYDAAQRGLSVALIERDDFGSGTSFNHLRTIHGGLRYLQRLDIARARESVRERRTIARIAPHAVRPTAFALPLYHSLTRGKIALRAGFLLDRVLASGRNRGLAATHRLPSLWDNPDDFDLDRFAPPREEHRRHPFALLPFGAGPRICLGMHFAQVEVKAMAVHILRHFELEPLEDTNPKEWGYLTSVPVEGIRVRVHAR